MKAKLTLAERTYECTTCGSRIDRDLNAAIILARQAGERAGVPGRNASGATQKTTGSVAAGDEAGSRNRGSVTPQGVTA